MYARLIQNSTFSGLMVLIFLFSWGMQHHFLCNADVSWLAEASKRMLSGGSYTKDYFENNPPWILYFYIPPVVIAKLFPVSIINSMRLYVMSLVVLSLIITRNILKVIFSDHIQVNKITKSILILLAIIYLIFPTSDFGQREHLLFVLITPYFLLLVVRFQDQKVNTYFSLLVGFLAVSVLMLKPYFFAPLVLLELYYIYHKRRLFAWVRPEVFSIFFVALVYSLLIVFRHLDYLLVVLPHVINWCYLGTKVSWFVLLSNMWTYNYLFLIYLCIITYNKNQYLHMSSIILITVGGFIISYACQRVTYNYRILPAASMELFGFLFYFIILLYATYKTRLDYFIKYAAIILFFILYINSLENFTATVINQLQLHPALFTFINLVLLSTVYYLRPYDGFIFKLSTYFKTVVPSLLIGSLFFYILSSLFNWSIIFLVGSVCPMILTFGLLMHGSFKEKIDVMFVTIFGMLLIYLPAIEIYNRYEMAKDYKTYYQPLVTWINNNASNKSIYFFTTELINTSLINNTYNNVRSASRFSGFWLLPGFIKQQTVFKYKYLDEQFKKDEKFFINMVIEDLALNKPDYLFIDDKENKFQFNYTKATKHINIQFDYLHFLSASSQFNRLFKNYYYLTTIKQYSYAKVNPLDYQLKLNYLAPPKEQEINSDTIYLYMDSGDKLEIAMLDLNSKIQKFKINAQVANVNQLRTIKQILKNPGSKLGNKEKQYILEWISKLQPHYEFYKYKIYKRREGDFVT